MQTLVISGCNDEVGSAQPSKANINAMASSPRSLHSGLDDKTLWANITQTDDRTIINSTLDIVYNNSSDYDVHLLGCDNNPNITNNLKKQVIPAHYFFPETKDFAAKWQQFANEDGGILDPKHIGDDNLQYNITSSDPTTYNCYYSAYLPSTGKTIAFKLHLNSYSVPTQGITTQGQPDVDIARMQSSDFGKKVTNKDITTANISHTAPWNKMQSSSYSLTQLIDEQDDAGLTQTVNRLNQEVSALQLQARSVTTSLGSDAGNTGELEQVFGIYPNDPKAATYLTNLKAAITNPGTHITGFYKKDSNIYAQVSTNQMNGRYGVSNKAYQLSSANDLTSLQQITGGTFTPKAADNFIIQSAADLLSKAQAAGFNVGDNSANAAQAIVGQMTVGQAILQNKYGSDSNFFHNPIYMGIFGSLLVVSGIFIYAIAPIIFTSQIAIFISAASGFALVCIGVDLILSAIDIATSKGSSSTEINHVELQPVSAADLVTLSRPYSSNTKLLGNVLAVLSKASTSTKYTSLNPDDPTAPSGSSLMQIGEFTLANQPNSNGITDADSQTGIAVTLQSVSNPWLRDPVNGDPYMGDNIDASHRGDSVIQVNFSNLNKSTATKDLEYKYSQVSAADLGLSTLAQDNRLPAPVVGIQSVTNTLTSTKLYQAGKSGLNSIYNHITSGASLDDWGIALNDNQAVALSVALYPGAESSIKYGGGLAANVVMEDSDGATTLMPIKSLSFKQALDKSNITIPYLYNSFSGSYPPKLGASSILNLSIGGYNDGKRHQGHIYISDAGSQTTVIPVYMHTHLAISPQAQEVTSQGLGNTTFIIKVKNFGNDDYAKVVVSNLPDGIIEKNNDCANGLKAGASCSITYDAVNVEEGSSNLMVSGILANTAAKQNSSAPLVKDADQQAFNLTVTD